MELSVDTWLWIFAAAIPFGMGALGGHLASNRPFYRWTFWILGVLGVVIVAVAGMRNQKAQDSLQNQLNKIEQNTEKKPVIAVNPTPVTVRAPNPPISRAKLDFTFLPTGPNGASIKQISKPLIDGIASVQLTAKNVGSAQANNGQIWIQICDKCSFSEIPEGTTSPPEDSTTRRKAFEHLRRGVYLDPTTLKVIPVAGLTAFDILLKYGCNECPPLDNAHPQKLRVKLDSH